MKEAEGKGVFSATMGRDGSMAKRDKLVGGEGDTFMIKNYLSEIDGKACSPELRLMLACACQEADSPLANEIRALLSPPFDWDLFLKLANHHRVYPLVYRTLRRLPEATVPEEVLSALKNKSRQGALLAMRMAGETVRVARAFKERGIPVAVLKGPPLAQQLYGDVGLRPSHDLDMLVRPEDLMAGGGVLEELGYRRIHPDFHLTPERLQLILKEVHHFSYLHEPSGILIELHWRMSPYCVELPFFEKNRMTAIRLAGNDVPVLGAEDAFLFLIYHGVKHGWFRLHWLCDIGKLLRYELDWEQVAKTAGELGIRTHLNQALILAEKLLNATVPEKLSLNPKSDRSALRLAEAAFPFFQDVDYQPCEKNRPSRWSLYLLEKRYSLQIQVGLINKLRYIWSHTMPAEDDIQQMDLPGGLFWIYYAIRPFTWVKRRFLRK